MPHSHDVVRAEADASVYECLSCGHIVEAESNPGDCADCGGEYQNRARSLE